MLAAESGTDVFHAIADPTRRSLLKLLANKEMSIASITDYYPISRTAVNKHLQVLFDAQLVSSGRLGINFVRSLCRSCRNGSLFLNNTGHIHYLHLKSM